jgi:hypothetical protein
MRFGNSAKIEVEPAGSSRLSFPPLRALARGAVALLARIVSEIVFAIEESPKTWILIGLGFYYAVRGLWFALGGVL